MSNYQLESNSDTLHGDYSRDRTPVLRIKSGDTVEASTLDAGWGLEAPHLDSTPRRRHPSHQEQRQRGHSLIGPIWIEGAEPGMTLVTHFEQMIPGDYGFTYSGGFQHRIHESLQLIEGGEELMLWALDTQKMIAVNQFGHQLKLKPFLGNLGMPPPEAGYHTTVSPRIWGGNIDCKDLVVNTRLYLPIPVAGGLFSFGDHLAG